MRRKFRRPALALGLIAAVAVLLALVAGVSSHHVAVAKSAKLAGDPDQASLKSRSIPGLSHEGNLGPASQLLLEELGDKTYPSATLPVAWQKNALDFFTSDIKNRGADGSGSWQLAGPTNATYPAVLNRFPNSYVASGRITALAIDSTCSPGNCRVWLGAAGGGVWRTDDALASSPSWKLVSSSFATSAIGVLTYDAASHTLYAGTGEQNESADSDAGVGIYKSTDGGDTWSLLPGSPAMSQGNSVASIVVSGSKLYVGTTFGVAAMAGVSGGAQPSYVAPGHPHPGVWVSGDGGSSFTQLYNDEAGAWGVNDLEVDSHGTLYMASVGKGIFRSADGGTTWEQVFHTQLPGGGRTEFALNTVNPGGHTRIYVGDGGSGSSNTAVYRADNIDTTLASALTADPPSGSPAGTPGTNPGFTKLTTGAASSGYMVNNYCTAQCWYDNYVVSPAGKPDVVYVGGSFDYNLQPFGIDNGKAVLLSQDAGAHWSDETADAEGNGIHPDQHALVVSPANPLQFFEGSDGGIIRSSGTTVNLSATKCPPLASLGAIFVTICNNANSAVPTELTPLNAGVTTLQFQTVSINPANVKDIQGGTQDNGTWEGTAGATDWNQSMYGDGGVSAFDSSNTSFRMNEFYAPYQDANFQNGDPTKWVVVSGKFWVDCPTATDPKARCPIEAAAFYKPLINDPTTSGTFFTGLQHVWRTKDFGGNQGYLEANCPEFTTDGADAHCGDFVALGDPSGVGGANVAGDLTASGVYGTDKSGGYVVALARAQTDNSTLWVATRRGRVFISKNANATAPGDVTFTRIDGLSSSASPTPRRFVSGIVIDPKNPNHAFVSFGGYNNATDGVTPAVPGHVFDVTYDPATGKATWSSLDNGNGPLGDMPINALALDQQTNRLYVATDFGVLVSVGKSGMWRPAADGLPVVAVSGLTLDSKNRVLYAATHGRAIWSLQLNGSGKK